MFDAAAAPTAAALASDADAHLAGSEAARPQESADRSAPPAAADQDARAATATGGETGRATREIVFVDARLPDLAQLAPAPNVELIVIDPDRDGLAQVTEALASRRDIDAIHFVGHGEAGEFSLGRTVVDGALVAARQGEIASWSAALTPDADIMIWGCDVAASPEGEALLHSLALLTGGDVAASSDSTGSAARGGDWSLESSTGAIEAAAPFEAAALASWGHLLAPPTLTGERNVSVSEPSTLNDDLGTSSSLRLGDAGWSIGYQPADADDLVTVTVNVADTGIGDFVDTVGGGVPSGGLWTFQGTMEQADLWLQGMTFHAADVERGNAIATTNVTVSVTNDTDSGTATRSLSVRVTASNDPTVLGDVTLDVDEIDPSGNPSVTVLDGTVLAPVDPEVEHGSQTKNQIVYTLETDTQYGYLTLGGVRIGQGSVFTQADVEAGLVAYVHTATGVDQNTQESFVVRVNDGATPLHLSEMATVRLNIRPVNQAPNVSGGGPVYEGQPANAVSPGPAPSIVGNYIVADGGGDPNDPTLTVWLDSLPRDGMLHFRGEVTIGGVTQTIDRMVTDADIAAGFSFAYADRAGLTYAHDGVDLASGRPAPQDSFDVTVIDGGGGAGPDAALSSSTTIVLDVRPVNDEPVWDESSTRAATVDGGYHVTLDASMLNVTDSDSADSSLSFIVTAADFDQGRLYLTPPGGGAAVPIPVGGTFTLADVKAGNVTYVQHIGAAAGDTDSFNFRVVDNGVTLHWREDGTHYERPSGVYVDPALENSALRDFTFTINLHETPTGEGGVLPPFPDLTPARASSEHAGTDQSGHTIGSLSEGGTVTLYDGKPVGGVDRPGLSYSVGGVAPEQIVYTVMSFDGVADGWNGELQLLVEGDWVTLNQYDSFTQDDLDNGRVRFVHDGGEDFESSVRLRASAGVLVDDGAGGLAMDEWITDFHFFAKPVNDAPVAEGSGDNLIKEGDTVAITTGMLNFSDVDDTASEAFYEGAATLPGGEPNYALNHDGAAALTFTITGQPANGVLQWFDGTSWQLVTPATVLHASWLTSDPATTRLRYVHGGGENLSDGFSVQATDRWGAQSNSASVGFTITPVNDPPDIASDPTQPDPTGPWPGGGGSGAVNEPMRIIYEGSWKKIDAGMLQAVDPDNDANQVQYSVTRAPAHGRLAYSTDGVNFTMLGVGSSFSQADIANGRIYYQHNGDEPNGNGYPDTPDDTFRFTLSDGASEVPGREFWIYVEPTNDAPVVTAPSGPIRSTDTTVSVPGFSVADPDLADGLIAAEADFLQVTVRLLDANGIPLAQSGYAGVTLSTTGATVDATRDGVGGILVLRGTSAEINAALATLSVQFSDDRDAIYQVQVIADDRVRDSGGALVDRDPAAPGVNVGGNGGGTFNQPDTPFVGLPTPVSDYDAFDWYADAVPSDTNGDPAIASLVGNISAAAVTIWASTVNDPAAMTGNGTATVYEDQRTFIGNQIAFQIADAESAAFGTPVTVTLTVPSGTLSLGALPAGLSVTVGGNNSGTLVLTGTAADIQAYLNDSLHYQSASNRNHDMNAGDAGDVTLRVTFDDTGSNIGSGGTSANPAPLDVALTIVPVNDRPGVTPGTGTVIVSGTTAVTGVSVSDLDINNDGSATPATGETDFIQVTVRLSTGAGTPLSLAQHGDVIFASTSAPAEGATFEIDDVETGNGRALVIRGTLAEVNAYLSGLTVTLQGTLANSDNSYRIDIIADDRVRDVATGTLVGTAANGGGNNNAAGGTVAVPTTAINPYGAVPGGLTANVNTGTRTIFPSSVNDAPEIRVNMPTVTEGGSTVQLSGIVVSDPDAQATDILEAVLSVPPGFSFFNYVASGATVTETGGVVTIRGTLAQINAAVNTFTVLLPDEPGAPQRTDWNGSFDVTIVVKDFGNRGGRPTTLPGDTDDPRSETGDPSYADPDANDGDPGNDNHLVTTRIFTVTVAPQNDAPVVVPVGGSTTIALPGTEDTSGPGVPAHSVGTLFQPYFSDPRDAITGGSIADNFAGVVVVGVSANAAQGEWQYFDGTSWTAIGTRTNANGLYLAADAQIRFVPAANFHGTPESLTVRLVEDDAGGDAGAFTPPVTGQVIDLSGAGATGGTTRFSTGTVVVTTAIANVNDAPTLTDATMPAIDEDFTTWVGQTVQAVFGAHYSDATDNQTGISGGGNAATPFGGIAIVGNHADPAEGEWQYSLDGGASWTAIGTGVSDADAIVLAPTARMRFVPAADFNGTPGRLDIRASDTPVTPGSGVDIGSEIGGAGSHWSATAALRINVNPLNDAPVLSGTPTNPTVTENGETGTGQSIPPTRLFAPGSVSLSDIDLSTTTGLASDTFGAGEIDLTLGASYLAGDRLAIDMTGYTLPAGVSIDTTHDGSNGRLVIRLDGATRIAEVIALIERLTYASSSDNPTDFDARTSRSYTLVVRDGNNADPQGDTAGGPASLASAPINGTITLVAVNDPPIAEDNVRAIAEDSASVSGNVITDLSPLNTVDRDPDTPVGDLRISGIAFGATTGTVGTALAGAYGTLTLNADGSYTYTLDNTNPAVNALKTGDTLSDVFVYTLSDGTAVDTANLTITINGRTDGVPTVTPTDHNGLALGQNEVSERGLGDAGDSSETTTGTVTLTAPDGLSSVTIGGQTLTLAQLAALGTTPVTITTPKGVLTLTGFTATASVGSIPVSGTLAYSYELTSAQDHAGGEVTDDFALSVLDAGGDSVAGILSIRIVDDAPVANNDSATIAENDATVTGNVVTTGPGADRVGADGATVTRIAFGPTVGTVGSGLDGAYGTLTLNADGSYSYALDNDNPLVNALRDGQTLTEVFTYRITDGDGDEATATLTITIDGRTDGTNTIVPRDSNGTALGQNEVSEVGLGLPGDASETTTGTIDLTAPDGLTSVTVGGQTLTVAQLTALGTTPVTITTPKGVLTLTGFTPTASVGGVPVSGALTYSYELTSAQDHSAGEVSDDFALVVTDVNSQTATGTLAIRILDSTPQAVDDTATVAEDGAPVTGNVFAAGGPGDAPDAIGNDGSATGGPVTGIAFEGTAGTVGSGLSGRYGTLTLNADGSYSYDVDNANAAVNGLRDGQTLTEVFTYRISDADGDHAFATLTITIDGRTDGPPAIVPRDANGGATGENSVSERGLGDPRDASETTRGVIDLTAPDGLASVTIGGRTVTAAELAALGTTPIRIVTPKGVVILTGFTPTTSIGGVPTAGELAYSYELTSAQDHAGGEITDDIALLVTDAGGDSQSGTLTILIADDAPQAVDDRGSVDEDGPPATGNVITDAPGADRVGADGAKVTHVSFGAIQGTVGNGLPGRYGQLTLNADGSYSYVLDNANPRVDALRDGETLTEVFTYRITDADGDEAIATLTITIRGRTDPVAPPVLVDTPEFGGSGLPERAYAMTTVQLGALTYLEGRPYDRYVTFTQTSSQQVLFRKWGGGGLGGLVYEATLGVNQPLPSWISFDPTMQMVTATPGYDVPPGVYIVRVVARDADGNYAESSVAFHVLRDITETLRLLRARAETIVLPDGPVEEADAPGEAAPAERSLPLRRGTPPADAPEAEPKGDAGREGKSDGKPEPRPRESRLPDASEPAHASSLSQSLIRAGNAAQMIEAARFLQALAGPLSADAE